MWRLYLCFTLDSWRYNCIYIYLLFVFVLIYSKEYPYDLVCKQYIYLGCLLKFNYKYDYLIPYFN